MPCTSGAAMRLLISAAVLATLHGCATDVADDDYSDETWSPPGAQDDVAAALEDPALGEDPAAPPVATDDTDDPTEADEPIDSLAAPALTTFVNPVATGCADPGVVRVEGADGPTFWVACTGNGYPLYRSRDLVHWTAAGHIFHAATRPAWAGGNWWAPEIHHVGSGYVAYFAALSPARNKMCIGAATAPAVDGPWRDLGHPLVCDPHVGLIDPNMVTDADGRHFLYYKTDSNALRPQEHTIIYGHELRADGVGFVGARHRLLENTLGWEGDVVEAPWVIQRGRYHYMFYSGFRYCNGTYGVGVARATSALGPFHKRSAPILHSNAAWTGPGHNAVVQAGGHRFLVYAAWHGAHACGGPGSRDLLLDPIGWRGGWPFVNDGTPSHGPRPRPQLP